MDTFISYSRKDKTFVQTLHKALTDRQKELWVDWKDIPVTSDWWAEIREGLESAHAFVFVISPNSVVSEVCNQELEYAVSHNKRLIPLVYREANAVPEVLSHLNWIFSRETDDFDEAIEYLLEAMDTDLDWVKRHTRLTRRAMEWERKDRNKSYLLRGDDLAEAEQHLSQPNRNPALTQLQQGYIVTSQQNQAADLMQELEQAKALAETEARRLEEQKQHNIQLRRRSMVIIGSLVLVMAMGVYAVLSARQNGALSHSAREVVAAIVEFADAEVNGDVCWSGALNGVADIVMPACKQAIALEPDVAFYYESRGLAYALMGNFEESSLDFKTAIETANTSDQSVARISLWEEWVDQIERGSNPFDEKLLHQMRESWKEEKEAHRSEYHSEETQ